ncbi:MAG: hypothetical protein BM557_05825 [Flavobacterium sp. MedPE-SWcel]|uniref:T9SS type A sorting domain-containing protein n=1 Tax=uncultured Flavobacterium sp. TaxID=165435 RepID=UPI00091128D0|nr:T9SS type A sorting domain-containing protein [uncultured Flavobacterium sp.]OIQ20186.1 MAG: hypothetical protein BM557_05825 [Flavobacterium sp. MedPE-SWcel]
MKITKISNVLLLFIVFTSGANAQCEIPNNEFEDWSPAYETVDYEVPTGWSETLIMNLFNRFPNPDGSPGFGFVSKYTGDDVSDGIGVLLQRTNQNINFAFMRFECDSPPTKLKGNYKFSGADDSDNDDIFMVSVYFVKATDTVPVSDLHTGYMPENAKNFYTSTSTDTFTEFEIDLSSFQSDVEYDYAVIQLILRAESFISTSSASAVVDNLKFVYDVAGTNDFNSDEIVIYPNPVYDKLYIKDEGDNHIKSINVFDLMGRLVLTTNNITDAINTIDISNLSKNVYILDVQLEDGKNYTEKLIKK